MHIQKTNKIKMIYTGGTIGMKRSRNGLSPDPNSIECFLDQNQLKDRIELIVAQPLIDSSALSIQNWNQWIKLINQDLGGYQGVIILHGTDTLAYTSGVLGLLYSQQKIPIVITGAILPLFEEDSDGQENIILSIQAIEQINRGVFVVFNRKMLHAFDCLKISAVSKNAFISPNLCPVAKYDQDAWLFENEFNHLLLSKFPKIDYENFQFCDEIKILNLFLTPTLISCIPSIVDSSQNWNALIFQSFGHGNFKINNDIKEIIRLFLENDKPVINVSQVVMSRVDGTYALGSDIIDTGGISARSFTFEFCYSLIAVALSCHKINKIKFIQKIITDIDDALTN
ncbi:MAG: hypothetical protein GKC53_02880 [Neisseriaceae bacterium]|nr:MAG: hypothetical protein GKC53_02880 [Neisseriaceae bacterium]